MNWKIFAKCPWIDTRAYFISKIKNGAKLLDIGSSDGETLNHFYELRPDIIYFATDILGSPDKYPYATQFYQCDIQKKKLPWSNETFDAITCMQLIEHLEDSSLLISECWRLLKPGGHIFFETPHPKTVALDSPPNKYAACFTINFYDDITHKKVISTGRLAHYLEHVGFNIKKTGISRNWFFSLSYLLYFFLPPSRKKFTAKNHLFGWSAYLVANKPL